MPTVMITGAKRGIGRGLVDQFVQAGWDVIASGRDATATDLARLGNQVTALDLDVTDDRSIAQAVATLNGRPLDLLVNNAGVNNIALNGFDALTRDAWLEELSVNTVAPFMVTRAFLPNLKAGERQHLAVVSSKMGSIEDNTSGGKYMYRSSKTALNMVLKSLSWDLREAGFTCVTLHPGWVQTDMGGPSAPTTVAESTRGLFAILDGLKPEHNGRFFNFDGTELPW
ncbi:MAG: SDR family oxidoreductase [Pseudomonadota bacterium]